MHVNDWRGETRDWDDRALPGEGVMDLPAILGALEAGGYDGWYDMEIFSGEHYPDSLMKLDPAEMVRRGREGFVQRVGGEPRVAGSAGRGDQGLDLLGRAHVVRAAEA